MSSRVSLSEKLAVRGGSLRKRSTPALNERGPRWFLANLSALNDEDEERKPALRLYLHSERKILLFGLRTGKLSGSWTSFIPRLFALMECVL